MFCPYCKKEIEDDSLFCSFCGSKIEVTTERDKIFSEKHPNYDEQTSTEFASCQSCGASIAEKSVEEPVTVLDAPETPKAKKQLPKKEVMFGAIGIAVIAVLIIAISLFSDVGKSNDNVVLYIKEQEIFVSDLKKGSKAWQLTSRLIGEESPISSIYEDVEYASDVLRASTCVSEDGKYIFFPDKIGDADYDGSKLYYREVDKPEGEAIKIDSEVQRYNVNTDATHVSYLKGEEENLYQYKIDEDSKYKIASGVKDYWVSDDGNKICYLNNDSSLYLKYTDKDTEKIAREVSSVEYLNDEITTIYYIKNDSLYKQVEGEDRIKIAPDVHSVLKIYDSGEIYYLKSEPEELLLMDKGTIEQPVYSLCYFNGTEETVITDTFSHLYEIATNAAVIAYEAYDQSHLESEIYIAVKDTATVVEQQENATAFTINADGTIVYYIDNILNDKDYGELYRIDITNGVIGKPELYDYDCDVSSICFVNESKLQYFKDYKTSENYEDSMGEMYIDKVRVGTDVRIWSVVNYGDCDKVFYLTDWNDDKECGTLKVYQGDKVTKIADDVYDYVVTNEGRAIYLSDYSLQYHMGELSEWNKGKTRKIDDDVMSIIPLMDSRGYYGGLMIATDIHIRTSHFLAALTEAPTEPPASNDEIFSELGNDASDKKSPVGTWELIGTYYGWEDEEELTQPVPLEKLSIWDGERITFTVYDDYIDFFGHVSKWSYENDEFCCSLETDYPQLGALYYVDENTMHYSLRGDIEVYKRVGNNTNNGTAAALPTVAQEKQAEWLKQIQALAYIAYDNMRGVGKATPEILLANPDGLRMYIYASTDYLFYDAWKKYDWDEAKRLIAFGDAFGAGCIADDYEAYIPESAIKDKLRNMFGSAAVEGFNFAGIFDNGFFHYEEGDPGDYLALSECEKTNWNDMSQIIFSYEYGYIEEDPDETLGNIVISTQADTTSPYGCVVKQIEWKNIG